MAKIRLAVVGSTLYAERLAESIRKNSPEYLEVFSCRMSGEIQEFLTQINPDVLLCEQAIEAEERLPKHVVQIQLVGETGQGINQGQIFRYQKGSEILRQVFHIYEQNSKRNLVYKCKTAEIEMTACYAPGGHEYLLPFSISYAALCGEDTKVLYLNLSEFSGMKTLFGDKGGNNLSDLIFGIRQKKGRFSICLQSVLHHAEQFDYILPPENPEDLYEIQEEDLASLLSLLQEQTEYKKIIWGCGTWNQAVRQVMECCGKVFCVVRENAFGKYRKTEFEAFLQKELQQRMREKVQYIDLQTGSGGFVQGVNLLTQLQSGEFAKQVKKMIEEEKNN